MNGCLVTFLVFLGLAFVGKLISPSSPSSDPRGGPVSTLAPAPDARLIALSEVKLDFSWHKDSLETMMLANFVVNNTSDYSIKDLEITCVHSANSGTRIDSNTRTIYEIVKAHSKRRFPEFNMGFIHSQATSSSCRITDLKVVDPISRAQPTHDTAAEQDLAYQKADRIVVRANPSLESNPYSATLYPTTTMRGFSPRVSATFSSVVILRVSPGMSAT
jgi:hypothetical protein